MEADFKVVSDRNGPCPSLGSALVIQLLSASFWQVLPSTAKICIECMVEWVYDNDVPISDTVHQQLSMCLKHKAFYFCRIRANILTLLCNLAVMCTWVATTHF